MNYTIGQQIARSYTVVSVGSGDAVFDRLVAVDGSNIQYSIWSLKGEFSERCAEPLLDYVERLMSISQRHLAVPKQVCSEPGIPVMICYRLDEVTKLRDLIESATSVGEILEIWEQVFESLFELHKNGFCHGYLSEDSFVSINNSLQLRDFGFAPLIDVGLDQARDICRDHLAPELTSSGVLTVQSDIYALGKLVGRIHPEVLTTNWYSVMTNLNLEIRPKRARGALDGLEQCLNGGPKILDSVAGGLEPVGDPIEPNRALPKPIYRVMATADPAGAGSISGAGEYVEGAKVVLTASANRGFTFSGWSGDITCPTARLEMKVVKDTAVQATFLAEAPAGRDRRRSKTPAAGLAGLVVGVGAGLFVVIGVVGFLVASKKPSSAVPNSPAVESQDANSGALPGGRQSATDRTSVASNATELLKKISVLKASADQTASKAFAFCASYNGTYIEKHSADPAIKQNAVNLAAETEVTVNQGIAIYSNNPGLSKDDYLPALDIDLALVLAIQQKPFTDQLHKAESEFRLIHDASHKIDAETTGRWLEAVARGERVIWADSVTPSSGSPANGTPSRA